MKTESIISKTIIDSESRVIELVASIDFTTGSVAWRIVEKQDYYTIKDTVTFKTYESARNAYITTVETWLVPDVSGMMLETKEE